MLSPQVTSSRTLGDTLTCDSQAVSKPCLICSRCTQPTTGRPVPGPSVHGCQTLLHSCSVPSKEVASLFPAAQAQLGAGVAAPLPRSSHQQILPVLTQKRFLSHRPAATWIPLPMSGAPNSSSCTYSCLCPVLRTGAR